MKNLQSFDEFFNESNNELTEGLSSKIFKLKDKSIYGLEWDSAWNYLKPAVEKVLGSKEKDIIQIDEYSAEEYPEIQAAYDYLEDNFEGEQDVEEMITYDPKLKVCRIEDMGFVAYLITKKSKL